MMNGAERLARPPQVEPLGGRNERQPMGIVVAEREGLGRRLGIGLGRARLRGRRVRRVVLD